MGRVTRTLLTTLGLAVLVSPLGAQDQIDWSGRLDQGQELRVRGISGDVIATIADGATAEVVATKRGRDSDFDLVEVEVIEDREGVLVCVLYGRNRGDSCEDYYDDDDDRDWGGRNIRVSVDFEVRVPAGVEFVGTTVSGDVEAEGLESDVHASSVSGDVIVSTSGVATASTVSGSLDIAIGDLDWDDLSYSTVSGDITLRLPANLDADVEFTSLSGDFDTDFDMDVTRSRERFVGSEVEGRIGSGGRDITFKTVSGDVRLREWRSRAR